MLSCEKQFRFQAVAAHQSCCGGTRPSSESSQCVRSPHGVDVPAGRSRTGTCRDVGRNLREGGRRRVDLLLGFRRLANGGRGRIAQLGWPRG